MNVGVYSLKNVLFHGGAKSVNLKTTRGEITILDNHRPLISVVATGVIKVEDAVGKIHEIAVESGFLEVRGNNEARFIVNEF